MSNFWIEPDGTHVEGEFQAAKHAGYPWRQAIIKRASPKHARKLGRRWKLSTYQLMEWNNRKDEVMYRLVRRKFDEHPELATALVATDPQLEIVEKNMWHDNYWGDCQCLRCFRKGENMLGQILMDIRDEYAEIPQRARSAA
jgi:ribA/ribD-fused uncharacterized protein